MNTNNLNTALFEKMTAEQDKFRDWLKSQPPEEVLNHAYEYTIREDIVMAMEELELTDTQAQALLESPSPLADVYRYFEKLETGYMDVIRDSIENRADDVCRAKEELRTTPIYPHSAAYASEHGEMAQYNRSYQANSACKEAIEQAISAHYAENRLDTEAAIKDVLEKFGTERVQFILANTIQRKNYDGRISQDNKTSVYKGYKQDKIEMRGDRAEMSDFPLYLNTVAGGLDRRDQTIGGFSFVVKIYAVPVVEIIG